jgi:hypothetical protein
MTVSVQSESPTRKKSRAKSKYRRIFRPLLDAAIAGMVFTLASSALVCTHAKAGIIPTAFHGVALAASIKPVAVNAVAEPGPLPLIQIATASSPAEAVYRQTSVSAAWTLLGVAFSLMAALNLALVRHLKRTYAPVVRRFPLGK